MSFSSIRRAAVVAAIVTVIAALLLPGTASAAVKPTASINNATVTEGNSGTTVAATFTITLDAAAANEVAVTYLTPNEGTATQGSSGDYQPANGSVTFAAGETSKTVSITINGDNVDELNETFTVELQTSPDYNIGDGSGLGTIIDDDQSAISIADSADVDENSLLIDEAATFNVTLSTASSRDITVTYSTQTGTAGTSDYTPVTSTLTIPAGTTSGSIEVDVTGDTIDEPHETFSVILSNPTSGATIADGTATATILDDDDPPTLSIGNATVTEGDNGTVNAVFTLTLSSASAFIVSGGWNTTDNEGEATATAGADYVAGSGPFSIPAGQTTTTVTVPVNGDTVPEQSETFFVHLSNPQNVTYADRLGEATITDNDASPTISISDVSLTEGTPVVLPTTKTFSFTVTLSGPSEEEITVDYSTQDVTATGSAVPGAGDYVTKSGTVTFAPNDTSETIDITVNGDATAEPSETFLVVLSNAESATVAEVSGTPDRGVGTIQNDDGAAPALSINNATVTEGNTGTTDAVFTVTLAPNVHQSTVRVAYSTESGTATENSDFESTNGILEFPVGTTSRTITVPVTGDTTDEAATESFTVVLSNPINASITDGTGDGTITDNDAAPVVTINDVSTTEGNLLSKMFAFTVSLSNPSSQEVSVNYTTANGTAQAGTDYTAASGTATIDPGDTSTTINVSVTGDLTFETNETFFVNLTAPVNATIGDGEGLGTIQNDDTAPEFSVSDAEASEGETLTFTVSLSRPSAVTATVKYQTVDGTAVAPGDYTAASLTTLTFAPGELSKDVTVQSVEDTIDEPNETFILRLSEPTGATVADSEGTGTITDDDGAASLSISDTSVNEGNGGSNDAVFTVRLLPASSGVVTVNWTTNEGSATEDDDYEAASGTLIFAPGDTSKEIRVAVNGDTIAEPAEQFTVTLSNPPGSSTPIADATGVATINDNDGTPPSLSVNDPPAVSEAAGSVTFTVTKTGTTTASVSVDYTTTAQSATADSDYTTKSGTLTIPAGQSSGTVTVTITNDTLDEPNETFTLNLSNASNATISDPSGTATINDNDDPVTVSINDVTTNEGNSGTANATFSVTLSAASGQTVTVNYATGGGTAAAGTDYTAASGTFTFAPGETSKSLVVAVSGDTVDEANETYNVTLSGVSGATIADATGVGTITDDDTAPAAAQQRYLLVGGDGKVYEFNAPHHGDMAGKQLNQPVIGLTMTPTGNGYWLVAKDGGIFTFGDAKFFGSMGDKKLNAPVLGMEATVTGKGYWLFAADGGIFTFGDAKFFGSTGSMKLNAPMIGMETIGSGEGYWLVAQDGGIFTFNTPFHGSTGSSKLNQPVFDMAALGDGSGYWLVARDGGIFTFNVPFHGAAVGMTASTVVGMRDTPSGDGYWIADANGKVMPFGDAKFLGDVRNVKLSAPIVGFAAVES